MTSRVHMFIDGFNLYHAVMNDSTLRQYRWLNFRKLGESLIPKREELSRVFYFTAFYPGDSAKRVRHQTFIDAQRLHGVETVLGAFRRKDKFCAHCKRTFSGYEEKETDVNIVSMLFRTAINDEFDKAMILSGDSDLVPAIQALKASFPQKELEVVFPPHRVSKHLKMVADRHMRLKEKHLASNQFPNQIIMGDVTILKPAQW